MAEPSGPQSDGQQRKAFDIEVVCDAFHKCIEDKNAIDLEAYLKAFTELLRFFHLLGTVFKFVADDVEQKIALLEKYQKCPDNGSHYQTVQKLIDYEKANNLLDVAYDVRPSGARTLLRLHRALEFVSQFMLEVSRLDDEKGTADVARVCYKKTLAKYHPWLIRKGASLAMYTLPYRHELVRRAYSGHIPDSDTRLTITDNMSRLAVIADEVFTATQKLYDDHNLLQLP